MPTGAQNHLDYKIRRTDKSWDKGVHSRSGLVWSADKSRAPTLSFRACLAPVLSRQRASVSYRVTEL